MTESTFVAAVNFCLVCWGLAGLAGGVAALIDTVNRAKRRRRGA